MEKYIKFSEAALICKCRFQQVYQRAVVRGKMSWRDEGKFKTVSLKDVEEWKANRIKGGWIT